MLTDPVADYLTRIRNAIQKRFDTVDMPKSNFKVEISKILKQEGYIVDFENAKDQKKQVQAVLKEAGAEGKSFARFRVGA